MSIMTTPKTAGDRKAWKSIRVHEHIDKRVRDFATQNRLTIVEAYDTITSLFTRLSEAEQVAAIRKEKTAG